MERQGRWGSCFFARLGYMERQGSGLCKIRTTYQNAINYEV